jgi:hypothetical protein
VDTPGYVKPTHQYGSGGCEENWAGTDFTVRNDESAPELACDAA